MPEGDGCTELIKNIKISSKRTNAHGEDTMRSTVRNLLSDLVREQVLINTREVPHSVQSKLRRLRR